jgi:transposase
LVLPALTSEGYITLDIFEGSINKERFIHFLEEQLVRVQDTIPLAIAYNIAGPTTHSLSWTAEFSTTVQFITMKKYAT